MKLLLQFILDQCDQQVIGKGYGQFLNQGSKICATFCMSKIELTFTPSHKHFLFPKTVHLASGVIHKLH